MILTTQLLYCTAHLSSKILYPVFLICGSNIMLYAKPKYEYILFYSLDTRNIPVSKLLTLAFCIILYQELEKQLAAKEVSLPPEPSSDNENAVTLLVRMPDGSRRGRRFLRSDNLQVKACKNFPTLSFPFSFGCLIILNPCLDFFQSLFDFIDVGRVVKPGTYRLVSIPFIAFKFYQLFCILLMIMPFNCYSPYR